ncbi:MAG: alkaline phosphatase family protein [Proteobacteria bacterium]|nr:alkaline phosphatase family protein [Pseudomonadota bacterium]
MLCDGARPDVMAEMAAAGELPVIQRTFIDPGGFRAGTSVFPTVSGPAHLPVLTGAHPGRANLPGIRWAERPSNRLGFLGKTRSYMTPFRSPKLQRDIAPDVTTLFAHIDGLADVNTWFVRGCPTASRFTRTSKASAWVKSLATTDWFSSDLAAEHAVVKAYDRGFPSVFAVFPAVDELGHKSGPRSPDSFEAYRRFDKALGRVIDALVRTHKLDGTLIVLTSDHGQSTTHTHFELDAFVRQTFPKTLSYPRLWNHVDDAECAVMVSGNAMANVYLAGSGGWDDYADMTSGRPLELVQRLLAQESIDHVIYRKGGGRACVVVGRHGTATVEPDVKTGDAQATSVRYTVTGVDPLGLGLPPEALGRDAIAQRTAHTVYPDAPWQLAEFYRSSRAGDLVVCAKPGYDLRANFEYQPHNGSHGGLHRDHMLVPAAVNGTWGREHVRTVDLFPSILHALGKPVPAAIDGEVVEIHR